MIGVWIGSDWIGFTLMDYLWTFTINEWILTSRFTILQVGIEIKAAFPLSLFFFSPSRFPHFPHFPLHTSLSCSLPPLPTLPFLSLLFPFHSYLSSSSSGLSVPSFPLKRDRVGSHPIQSSESDDISRSKRISGYRPI